MSDTPDLAALFGAGDTTTFLGLAECENIETLDASSALIGVPGATPYGAVGAYCRNGPDALRRSIGALAANVAHHNFDIGGSLFPEGSKPAVDCGDLPFDAVDFAANRAAITHAVQAISARGTVPIVVGGDDSVPIPMIDAFANTGRNYTILQIDAHIDWRDNHMDERLGLSSTMRRASEMAHISRIIQVGARGIGSARPEDLRDALAWGVSFVTAHDVHRNGTAPVIEMIEPGSDVIICFDVDALDPSLVPGAIGRAPGGMTYTQVLDLLAGAFDRGRIAAIDFVEFMPEVDVDGLGAMNVSRLIAATMGLIARQDCNRR